LSSAVGWSEKFDMLNDLGSAYHFLREYEHAFNVWQQALPFAEKIKEKFGESDRLYIIITNLVISYRIKKDYSTISQLLKRVEPDFQDFNPRWAGILCFSQALMASNMGDDALARQKLMESLDHFKETLDDALIGKGIHNIAYHNYLTRDFSSAKELYERAIQQLTNHTIPRLISMVDLVKTLLILNEKETALKLIQCAFAIEELSNDPDLEAKFHVLHSVATNEPGHAELVLSFENIDQKVRLIACKFLLNFYTQRDDAESVLRYHKYAESVYNSSSEWREL
jgi:tetratricopeptide (TPR) repeat protein